MSRRSRGAHKQQNARRVDRHRDTSDSIASGDFVSDSVASDGVPAFARFTTPQRLTHQPGLDGLRGLAVAAVVTFHLDVAGLTGGYLGVSLFFTLSGFLIGSLVLNEITTTGRFSLRRFWGRRARRLLPPALITLTVLAIGRLWTAHLIGTSGADLVASAANVANWHFLAEEASYGDLFTGPSAVLHFWSLAIEEQFYLAAGALAVLLASTSTRPVGTVGVVAGCVAALSFATPFVTGFGVDRVYYGTDTRAGELMIGVAAAAVFASASRRDVLLGRSGTAAAVGLVALGGTLALWSAATPGSVAISNGLLPLTALLSLAVIIGALLPRGPVAAIATWAPLRSLGRISYALYLIHWPVIVIANQITTDRSLVRAVILVVISLVLAQLSSVLVERPVRRQRVRLAPLAAAAAVAVVAIGTASALEGRTSESAALLAELSEQPSPAERASAGSDSSTTTTGSDVIRVALYGDSVAFSLLLSLGQASVEPDFVRAESDVNLGCGIAVSPSPPPEAQRQCGDPAERFALKAVAGDVTVAVMISCQWELLPQRLPGSGSELLTIGDTEFDTFVRDQYAHVADRLSDAGVERILWMRCPYMSQTTGVAGLSPAFAASRQPARIDRLNAVITEIAEARADVDVLRFDEWVNERVDDASIRPDGSHYEFEDPNPAADAFIEAINAALAAAPERVG